MEFIIGLVLGTVLGAAAMVCYLLPKITATNKAHQASVAMLDDSVRQNQEAKKELKRAKRFYEESNRIYKEIQDRVGGSSINWDNVSKSIPDNMPLTDDDVLAVLMDAAVPLEVLAGEPQNPHLSPTVNAEIRRVVLKIRAIVSQKAKS